ncbi:TRAM domain-containing protein [Halocatena marina]|uniref:TRAM domain-containing protein n=1 Tax=Halocatena marina TaxID=2934937 RepID=A0ABD5YIM4_9EURY|nr:TRAM domain-containing protein [Halocatena marina]
MVEISDNLRTVFTGTVEHRGDDYVIEIPDDEVTHGTISPGSVYRIALLNTPDSDGFVETETEATEPTPPVTEGDQRTVTIEAVGSEGDGIAKVERGYVIIVPDCNPGDEVEVEIERVTPTVAFADLANEHSVAPSESPNE